MRYIRKTSIFQRKRLSGFIKIKRTHRTWDRFKNHQLAFVSWILLLALMAFSFSAPLFSRYATHYEVGQVDLSNRFAPISLKNPFGTDELGRDVLTRILYGGRVSLLVGITAAIAATAIGTLIGAIAGYYGGWMDILLMRFTDTMISLPTLPLMIILAAVDLPKRLDLNALPLGIDASVLNIIIIVVIFSWMGVARLVRGSVLSLKERDFVVAAQALGVSGARIISTYLIPNCMAPIIVSATLSVGGNILYESALSFLGLGIQPPVPSWGNMLTNAQDYLHKAPTLAIFPGFFILLTVVSINFLGDGLRDALDPHFVQGRKKNKRIL
jgi:peptide/nickel transport system permease protein